MGGAEIYRNTEQDIGRRQYPGGVFDPLGLASGSDERAFNLKTAELKHGRLAMVRICQYLPRETDLSMTRMFEKGEDPTTVQQVSTTLLSSMLH